VRTFAMRAACLHLLVHQCVYPQGAFNHLTLGPYPPHQVHNTTHVQVVVLQAHQAHAQVLVVGRPPRLLLPLVRASRHVR